jgi:DNA-binding NarL/FixJ family response regulator
MKSKAIIIEDSYVVANLVESILQETFNTESTILTKDDIHYGTVQESSVVIMDYYLGSIKGGLNGVTIVKKIREYNPNMPVIAFSGSHDPEIIREILDLNVMCLIKKNEDDFLDKLKGALTIVLGQGTSKKYSTFA